MYVNGGLAASADGTEGNDAEAELADGGRAVVVGSGEAGVADPAGRATGARAAGVGAGGGRTAVRPAAWRMANGVRAEVDESAEAEAANECGPSSGLS